MLPLYRPGTCSRAALHRILGQGPGVILLCNQVMQSFLDEILDIVTEYLSFCLKLRFGPRPQEFTDECPQELTKESPVLDLREIRCCVLAGRPVHRSMSPMERRHHYRANAVDQQQQRKFQEELRKSANSPTLAPRSRTKRLKQRTYYSFYAAWQNAQSLLFRALIPAPSIRPPNFKGILSVVPNDRRHKMHRNVAKHWSKIDPHLDLRRCHWQHREARAKWVPSSHCPSVQAPC